MFSWRFSIGCLLVLNIRVGVGPQHGREPEKSEGFSTGSCEVWKKNTGVPCEPDLCFGVIKLRISKESNNTITVPWYDFEWLAHNSALFGLVLKIDPCAEWDGYLRKADANYYKRAPPFGDVGRKLLDHTEPEGTWLFEETAWFFPMTIKLHRSISKALQGKSNSNLASGLCSDRLADAQNHLWRVSVWRPCLPEARRKASQSPQGHWPSTRSPKRFFGCQRVSIHHRLGWKIGTPDWKGLREREIRERDIYIYIYVYLFIHCTNSVVLVAPNSQLRRNPPFGKETRLVQLARRVAV